MPAFDPYQALVIPVASALICAGLIVMLRPLLRRYALARPNARSSHVIPTPQGGGINVMAATAIAAIIAGLLGISAFSHEIAVVIAAAFCLAVVGIVDDLRPIQVIPRLALQLAVVAALVAALPAAM
jgi:UDP-N-acetylmuramyl pentapeptide phosphotransferase/UDP-N-acetylglucosamine-1-phosphate transferase